MSASPFTWWLSMHAPYACRHAGVCCSSGWVIPVERERVVPLAALAAGRAWLRDHPAALVDAAGSLAVDEGHCIFHQRTCEVQRALGPAALPSACQHFPRVVRIDPRGVFVTLSHYCPTAADLLFDGAGPVRIVPGPCANPHGPADGLDARGVLPPLLTSGVLMDWEGYSAWEAHMVHALTRLDALTPAEVLSRLTAHATQLARWRPGKRSLVEAVRTLAQDTATSRSASPHEGASEPPCDHAALPLASITMHRVIRRFLAAHAFASWHAFQEDGLRGLMSALDHALVTLQQELGQTAGEAHPPPTRAHLRAALGRADLRLRHTA